MREELLSVGIDIGTSTTQLIFSKIIVENMASSYSVPRIVIVDKEIIYRSEIYFTPLISLREIDGLKVRDIIQNIKRLVLTLLKLIQVPSLSQVKQLEKKTQKKY